jgi:tryptophan 2,3-dioxygenase
MNDDNNIRNLDKGLKLDVSERDNYGGYLCLEQVLSAQKPLSNPPHHDEMLFIIQHQVSELWLKLIVHELTAAVTHIQNNELDIASKILARVKQVQRQLYEQWAVLETLTPSEYIQFRDVFGHASGFQSVQYRMVEFLLGNKNKQILKMFPKESESHNTLEKALNSPSIYDVFLIHLSKLGYSIPDELTERDWSLPHVFNEELVQVFVDVYKDTNKHWDVYALCEQLVDVDNKCALPTSGLSPMFLSYL